MAWLWQGGDSWSYFQQTWVKLVCLCSPISSTGWSRQDAWKWARLLLSLQNIFLVINQFWERKECNLFLLMAFALAMRRVQGFILFFLELYHFLLFYFFLIVGAMQRIAALSCGFPYCPEILCQLLTFTLLTYFITSGLFGIGKSNLSLKSLRKLTFRAQRSWHVSLLVHLKFAFLWPTVVGDAWAGKEQGASPVQVEHF